MIQPLPCKTADKRQKYMTIPGMIEKDDPPMAYAYPLPEYHRWPESKYMGWIA